MFQKVKELSRIAGIVIFSCIIVLYLMPLIITFTNSFMNRSEVKRRYDRGENYIDMELVPDKVTLSQYGELLIDSPIYLVMFWNSVKIVFPIVMGQLVVSVFAAYSFTVMKFRGKEIIFFLYIIVMLLPIQVTLLPNYIVADWLNIKDSYLAIILPGIFQPFGTFLLRQYMKSMPESYMEAAMIDGAGHVRILTLIVLPMLKPGLAATAILTLLDYWNLVDQAVVFIGEDGKQPLSMFLARINEGEAGLAFAGSVFYAVPVILLLLYGEKYMKRGIAVSGLKG